MEPWLKVSLLMPVSQTFWHRLTPLSAEDGRQLSHSNHNYEYLLAVPLDEGGGWGVGGGRVGG